MQILRISNFQISRISIFQTFYFQFLSQFKISEMEKWTIFWAERTLFEIFVLLRNLNHEFLIRKAIIKSNNEW